MYGCMPQELKVIVHHAIRSYLALWKDVRTQEYLVVTSVVFIEIIAESHSQDDALP